MPISEKDLEFMKQVVAYFENTKNEAEPEGSIQDAAQHFNINRAKVRKILITAGRICSPITETALALREQGLSIQEIAATLGYSASTVSMYLPYADKVDNSLAPSPHAAEVREYRAYERQQQEREAKKRDQAQKELGVEADHGSEFGDRLREKAFDDSWKQEWIKDKKMSYTETYHRPRRETWEDAEKIREQLGLDSDPEGKERLSMTAQMDGQTAEEEAELEALRKRKNLSDEEKTRLENLRHRLGRFPGALNDRNKKDLEKLSGEKLPFSPGAVLRLHMELCDPWHPERTLDQESIKILKRYGEVKRGTTISRDVVVPSDLPLYALHYVIQKAFGWQNSHLHQFSIPEERARILCHDKASVWSRLVGVLFVLFRSPLMGEEDEFWADDYMGGSYKNWLRKKYTGPYLSLNHGEGLIPCQQDMMSLDMKQEYDVFYEKTDYPTILQRDEYIASFEELPLEALGRLFDRDPLSLIERLPVDSVLLPGQNSLGDLKEEEICSTGKALYDALGKYIHDIIDRQEDTPEAQVCPLPFTDVLYYTYDFGDDWTVRITASRNCEDLMEQLSQKELDKAQIKCREIYRPVMIARDGLFVMDDMGGLHGYLDFLQTINPDLESMDSEEKTVAKQSRREYLTWAKGQGWKKDNTTNLNFL